MEVTQTRLTNVHDSVEAYNAATTGATVPYHVLVLAGFPAGLSDRAAELLGRLARNGPRSGLYIVATVDPGLEMPRGFDLDALAVLGTTLSVDSRGDLGWDDPDFGGGVIEPDQMPGAARANPWLDAVGAAAGSAYRDLPFGRIAVPAARRWAGDATDGLDVQIGVDSKGEPQHFALGVRGVHHGLVGGDVRMGKTNLLHVLISQLALRYPPEELELYLLDFKEVEFDAYLTERLPHARAITSRTDREFGLSMLRRFHDEIERRARLCREARVTDLPDYRRETGQVLPRALVIMDEFQVLFSEEDRLAREAGRPRIGEPRAGEPGAWERNGAALTGIHADIDALKGLHGALVTYRHAQREVTARGEDQLRVTRASLEAKVGRCRAKLELSQAEFGACQDRAARAAAADTAGGTVDCSGYARAAEQSAERLEHIRRWQQRIDAEASEFGGIAGRFADLLENELPRLEEHLAAIIASLEAARRVQAPAS